MDRTFCSTLDFEVTMNFDFFAGTVWGVFFMAFIQWMRHRKEVKDLRKTIDETRAELKEIEKRQP